jgi:hypothetical protein
MSSETDRNVLLAVVDAKGQTDELRQMVERRDQILITSLRPLSRALSAFLKMYPSTNGPFHTERDMGAPLLLLALMARANDEFVGRLFERVRLPLVGLPQGVTG